MEVFCDASPRRIAINLLGISLQGMFLCKVHHRKQNRVQVAFGKSLPAFDRKFAKRCGNLGIVSRKFFSWQKLV